MARSPQHPDNAVRRPAVRRRALCWGASVAALALMPKCLVCLAAYLGVAAALGLGGPELCGAPRTEMAPWPWAGFAVGVAIAVAIAVRRERRR